MTAIINLITKLINMCALGFMIIALLVFHGEEKDFLLIKSGQIKIKAFEDGNLVPYFKRIIRRD